MNAARRSIVAITTLIVLVAVGLAGVFAAGASAGALVRPQIAVAGGQVVGTHQTVSPGQHQARAPDYDRMAAGSSVAAEEEPAVAAVVHHTFEPGPYAGDSIPARSADQTFTSAERKAINQAGYDTGCHTCGTTDPGTVSGNFIPDHQPVSALNSKGLPQRLYPQCLACSREEGLATARYLRGLDR